MGALPGLLLPHGPVQVLLESSVLLIFLPGISRRLHDLNLTLWLVTGLWAIYGAVLAIQTTGVFGARRSLATLLSDLPLFVLVLLLFLVPGTEGPNRFGKRKGNPDSGSAV